MRWILALLLAIVAVQAAAQTVFRWVDDDGEVHYGHSVPQEYLEDGYERISDGRVLERVDRALTLEERQAAMAMMVAERDEASRRQSRESLDRMLMASYSSEEDILESRDSELAVIRSQVGSARASMENAIHDYRQLIAEAASLERAAEDVPDPLAERIREAHAEVREKREEIERIRATMVEIEAHFQQNLERFRELSEDS